VPINFAVPKRPAPVVSGLRLKDRVLIRRTDFGPQAGPVEVKVGSNTVKVPSVPEKCQLLSLP